MDEMKKEDLVMTNEQKERKQALLYMAFHVGPDDMFPSTPVPRKCKQCGAARKLYQDCSNPECLAKWPT